MAEIRSGEGGNLVNQLLASYAAAPHLIETLADTF